MATSPVSVIFVGLQPTGFFGITICEAWQWYGLKSDMFWSGAFSYLRFQVVLGFTFCRSGWHRESGGDRRLSVHLTVDFETRGEVHYSTHHVYACEEAYLGI